jgi:RIO kinase 1
VHPSSAPPREPPAWLLDQPYDEISLGTLKSGKEAEVSLIERRYGGGSSVLLAHKRYRPRRPSRGELRELGFVKSTAYRHDSTYRAGWFLSSRDRRAVAHKTDHGHDVIERMWPIQEMEMLERAWACGASVPYPVERTEDGVVMEFIGEVDAAAPRLAQAQLSPTQHAEAWTQLLDSLRKLTEAGIVHADMSAYNLLWWRERLVIIDLPQAVEFISNADAPDLLHRDIANVAAWFGRCGLGVDVEAVFGELIGLAW